MFSYRRSRCSWRFTDVCNFDEIRVSQIALNWGNAIAYLLNHRNLPNLTIFGSLLAFYWRFIGVCFV